MGLSFDFLSAVLFYAAVLILIFKYRKSFEKVYGVFFLYKTKKGLKWITKIGKKYSTIIKVLGSFGVIISVYFIIKIPLLLWDQAIKIIQPGETQSQLVLLIPGIQIPGSQFYVPFWYGIISLIILVFLHELAHALMSAAENVKLKSGGVGFLLFLPLAFIEPDEKQILRKKPITRLRIATAGSALNITLAVLTALFLTFLLTPVSAKFFQPTGVKIISTNPDYPIINSTLKEGEIITAINNYTIKTLNDLSTVLNLLQPGQLVNVTTINATHQLLLGSNPTNSSKPMIGATFEQYYEKTSFAEKHSLITLVFVVLTKFLEWFSFLNFGVGVMNLLPLWFVDGGQAVNAIFETIFKNNKALRNRLVNSIFLITLSLFLINILGPLIL